MKPSVLPLTMLAIAAFGCMPVVAQTTAFTDPVGYVTNNSFSGNFCLFGLTVHGPTLYAGSGEITATTFYSATANFDSGLDSSRKYLIEITSGTSAGEVVEITSFAIGTLILARQLPVETNVQYRIREIPLLSMIIPKVTLIGTDDFNPDNADLILLPDNNGGFRQYYYSTYLNPAHPQYHDVYINAATGEPEDPHMFYPNGFFYLRRGSDSGHILTGELKMRSNTWLSVNQTFNYFSSVYPVGLTLGNSGLAASLQAGTADTADIVWMQDEFGTWRKYFHSNGTAPLGAGWREVDAPAGQENADRADVPLSSGLAIHRRAPAPYRVLLTPPEFYFEPPP